MNKDIKSTRIHIYGGHIYDGEYVPEKLMNTTEVEYDTDGRVESRKYYDYSVNGNGVIREYITRRRMENGLVIYEEFDSNNKIVAYDKFDKDGHLLECLWDDGEKSFYIYDENGNEIEHYSLYEDGKRFDCVRYEYDSNNRKIKSFHGHDVPCSCQYYYSKDIMGNIVETAHGDIGQYLSSEIRKRNQEDTFEFKDEIYDEEYTGSVKLYDKKGNILCHLSWSEDDLVNAYRMLYFNYDERGNWIMKIETPLIILDNPELESSISNECTISVREIEYSCDNNDDFFL